MTNIAPQTGYAPVNGLQMYYEIHGTGKPLVLIHGGFGVIGMFAQLLPALAATRQVIAVELQAHGHTADIDRPLTIEFMADDIAALVKHLGFENADIFGYSLGGSVALQTAIRHPDVVNKLVVLSAPYKSDGWYPEVRAGMGSMSAEAMAGTIMHDAYMNSAPRPEDWPVLVTKTKEMILHHIPSLSAEQVEQIKAPTLLIIGDSDIIQPEHAVEMFRLLGGGVSGDSVGLPNSQLAILPGTSHVTVVDRADLLLPIITPFLDAPLPEAE